MRMLSTHRHVPSCRRRTAKVSGRGCAGAAGFNQGNIAAYPRIELAIPEAGEVTLTIAGNALRVQVSGEGNLVLDMETGVVCDETGAPSPIAREMSGSRLTLPVGEWNLSLSGNVTGGAMDVRTRWV